MLAGGPVGGPDAGTGAEVTGASGQFDQDVRGVVRVRLAAQVRQEFAGFRRRSAG